MYAVRAVLISAVLFAVPAWSGGIYPSLLRPSARMKGRPLLPPDDCERETRRYLPAPATCSFFSGLVTINVTPVPGNPHHAFDPITKVQAALSVSPLHRVKAFGFTIELGTVGTGTYNPDTGVIQVNFTGGTYAGFAVTSTLTLTPNSSGGWTGTLSIGGKGQLPQDVPSDYNASAAVDFDGHTAACNDAGEAGEPISTATGELYSHFAPDLDLGGGPLRVRFERYYASLLSLNGITSALGANWMHNYDVHLYVLGTSANVVRFGGKVVRFRQSGGTWQTVGTERYGDQLVTGADNRYYSPYDGLIYSFDSNGNLTRIQDRNGNAIAVTQGPDGPVQVSDGLGRTLTFAYTGGSLTKVTDQSGRSISFAQTKGDLTSFTDAAGKTTGYTYVSFATASLLQTTTLPAGNKGFSQAYDTFGRVTRQTDALNNIGAALTYDAATRTATIADGAGNKTTHTYATPSLISAFADPLGKSGAIAYDASARPVSFTDRNGNKTLTTYHAASGYPATVTDPDGNTTTYTYTASTSGGFTFFDITGVTYADGAAWSFARDANGNLVRMTDGNGKVTAYTRNSRGQELTVVNPASGTSTFTYNADGTVATFTDAAGNARSYTYDALKRSTQVKYADGATVNGVYDSLGRIAQIVDPRGKVTKYSYDDNGKLVAVTDPLGNVTSYVYDAAENLTAVRSSRGTTTYAYDTARRLKSVTAPTGETQTYSYDADSRLAAVADAAGQLAAIAYDNERGATAYSDGANRKWTIVSDALGQLTSFKTPAGETWQQTFDKRNRVAGAKDPLGRSVTFSYDGLGRTVAATAPGPIEASYTRDALGGIAVVTDPNGSKWTRSYDSSGRLVSKTDPAGNKVTYTYDSRNRVSGASSSVGSVQVTYDAAGNQTRRLYSDGTDINYTYDDRGRQTGGTGVSIVRDAVNGIGTSGLPVTRDAAGRVASISYPAGKVTYTYNNRGLLAQVADWAGGTVSFTYDASLRLTAIARSNGVKTAYTYDANGRLAGIAETGTSMLASIVLQRDAAGRIVSADRTQPQPVSPASGVESNTYDAAHRLTAATYDGLGRLVKDQLRTYTFNAASRLTSYQGADGSASFTYDAFGMRTSSTSGGVKVDYVVSYATRQPTVAVVQSGGSDQRYYIWSPEGALLYAVDAAGNARHFYHFDESGNTLLLTGDTGAVTDSYGIPAYGESVVHQGGTANPFTWQGAYGVMQEGSTSLYYMRARYYDSATARFLSRDPSPTFAPAAIAPYEYALGDPVRLHDPSGRTPESGFGGRESGCGGLPFPLPRLLPLGPDILGPEDPLVLPSPEPFDAFPSTNAGEGEGESVPVDEVM